MSELLLPLANRSSPRRKFGGQLEKENLCLQKRLETALYFRGHKERRQKTERRKAFRHTKIRKMKYRVMLNCLLILKIEYFLLPWRQ